MKIVDGKDYLSEVKELIREYSKHLGRDLSFQNIEDELKDPSNKYTAPEGEILVAIDGEKVLGMVAYHRHSDMRCEMKRLYVRQTARGMHLGDTLVNEILAHAKKSGLPRNRVGYDSSSESRHLLVQKHGFEECEAYYYNPMDDVIYMRKTL